MYLILNVGFAFLTGMYSSYTFLYLKYLLLSVGGIETTVLNDLLIILATSMLLEFIAEPITGDWADTYGRKRIIASAFLAQAVAFLVYWSLSIHNVLHVLTGSERRAIVALACGAEFAFAMSAALFNGALDAWFVDELLIVNGPKADALQPFFSIQRRWFGGFMLLGGTTSLLVAKVAFGHAVPEHRRASPWLIATVLALLMGLYVASYLNEHRQKSDNSEPAARRIWSRFGRTMRVPNLRRSLLICSALYTCWICFLYLVPVLLSEEDIVRHAGPFRFIVVNYTCYYVIVGLGRFLGPYLSNRFRLGRDVATQFRNWGTLNCTILGVAGTLFYLNSPVCSFAPQSVREYLVPLALILLIATKVSEEAFKPVRATYLNSLIPDSTDRAFVLSMATPFGAIVVVLGIVVLTVSTRLFEASREALVSIPALFVFLGLIGISSIAWLSRPAVIPRDTSEDIS